MMENNKVHQPLWEEDAIPSSVYFINQNGHIVCRGERKFRPLKKHYADRLKKSLPKKIFQDLNVSHQMDEGDRKL